MFAVLTILVAYLLGCINTGFYLVKSLSHCDIRTISSGGTGSRNVGRLLGTKGFIITFIGDAGKGLFAVWLARYLFAADWLVGLIFLAVICGHIWPFQLSFRGGKGFATYAGGMLLFAPLVLLYGFLLSVVVLLFIRRTTISGLLALACSPLFIVIDNVRNGLNWNTSEFAIYFFIVAIVLFGHRGNIRKFYLS